MKRSPLPFFFTVTFLLIICLFTAQVASSQSAPWIVATYRYAENDRIANIKPLADHLAKQLNHPVEVRSYPTVHAFITALQKGEVDIALINTFGYLLLQAATQKHSMIPVAVLQPKAGVEDNYKTAILASKGSGVTSMEQLSQVSRRLRLALVSRGSTSGNLVPRLSLSRIGLSDPEKQFQQLSYSGNHRLAIDSLLAGKADIAAVGSTEYFKLLEDSSRASQCRLLWLSPEIPLGPVLLHKRLGKEVRSKILAVLLSIHNKDSPALESVKRGWSEAKDAEKYVPFTKDYYKPFLAQIGSDDAIRKIVGQFAN